MGALAGWLFNRYPAIYGLDVKGGVRITYQIDDSKLTTEQKMRKAEYKENILLTLKNRASSSLGVAEPRVIAKGDDQFVVELPGATDADEAKRVLGTSASIKFYHARNVATEKASYRNYKSPKEETLPNSDHAVVVFDYLGKKIKPHDPEYDRMIQGWDLLAQGGDLAKAQAIPAGATGSYWPEMNFTGAGADKIEQWSRRYQNEGEMLAAVLDDEVLSIAGLRQGAILRDNAVIEGTFDKNYVVKLVNLLNSGSLPVDLKVLSSEKVDATIGTYAYNQMLTAGAIAFGVIAIFLIGYYAFPGFIALLALLLYMLFTLTALKFMGATFSLASIAGFVLSVGMAVDANILVFERFKEEMKSGKSLVAGMDLGFRRAFPAIVDSNMCTIITSIVLATLGTGPVKGFATTLIIGVGISLFTAVSVTRSLLFFAVGSGIANNPKIYGLNHEWFGKRFEEGSAPLRVVEKSKKWFILSGLTILVGVPFAFIGGFKLNVEFRGGTEVQYRMKDGASQTADQLTKGLEAAGFHSPNVQFGSAGQTGKLAYITIEDSPLLKTAADPKKDLTDQEIQKLVADKSGIQADFISVSKVGPAIQGETIQNAVTGVVLSSLLIVIYLAFRFGLSVGGFGPGLRFALAAIGALVHDILVVFFLAAVVGYFMHWEISALFITAMLTIIGFSVHDTIVIFDRIRENLRKSAAGVDFGDLMDRSITQSFARSINTSMTVIVTLLILVLFGTATVDLKFFCVAMLVGIISGTYSSIYNASPILYLIDRAIGASKGPQATLVGLAHAESARSRIVAPHVAAAAAGAPAGPTEAAPPSGRTYGQVKRRANQAKDSVRNYDDEP